MEKRIQLFLYCSVLVLFISHEVSSDLVSPGNTAYEKCVEYSKLAYGSDSKLDDGKPIQCGQKIGGEVSLYNSNAAAKEFPNVVALGYADSGNEDSPIRWSCTGTLISDEFVLTSGHCLQARGLSLKVVRVGELDLSDENDDAKSKDYEVSKTFVYPDYAIKNGKYNDIGLVQLKEKVTLSSYVFPACLNWDPVIEEKFAILLGWGNTETGGERHDNLQKVNVEFFDNEQCRVAYEPYISRHLKQGIVNESQLCAGHHEKGNEICQGAGPLVVPQKGGIDCMYSVVGVTSLGVGCNINDVPAVYTRVSHYVDWISSIVWP